MIAEIPDAFWVLKILYSCSFLGVVTLPTPINTSVGKFKDLEASVSTL